MNIKYLCIFACIIVLCVVFVMYYFNVNSITADDTPDSDTLQNVNRIKMIIDRKPFKSQMERIMIPSILADINDIDNHNMYVDTIKKALANKAIKKMHVDKKVPNIETIINRAEMMDLQMNEIVPTRRRLTVDYLPIEYDDFDIQDAIYNSYRQLRNKVAHIKINQFRDKSNKETAQKGFFNVIVKPSSQNVHDTNVNNEFKNKLDMIKKSPELSVINDITTKAFGHPNEDKIIKCLRSISEDDENVIKFGETQLEILSKIWTRVNSPENIENKDAMTKVLLQALSDGADVCVTGRVDRIIDTLTLLDKNPVLANPVKTMDIFRKEVLDYSYKYLQDKLKEKGDAFTKLYNTTYDNEDVNKFNEDTYQEISEYVKNTYTTDFNADTINNILIEVKHGLS